MKVKNAGKGKYRKKMQGKENIGRRERKCQEKKMQGKQMQESKMQGKENVGKENVLEKNMRGKENAGVENTEKENAALVLRRPGKNNYIFFVLLSYLSVVIGRGEAFTPFLPVLCMGCPSTLQIFLFFSPRETVFFMYNNDILHHLSILVSTPANY